MYSEKNTNKRTTWGGVLLNRKGIIPVFVMTLTILIMLISIGYAALNQNINISGEAFLRVQESVRISRIELSDATDEGYETYTPEYSKKGIKVYSTLPSINSKVTYNAQITNTTGAKYTVDSIEVTNTNANVECTSSITKGSIIENGISDFTVEVKYKSGVELNEETTDVCSIKYEFIPLDLIPPTLDVELISQENNTAKIRITAQDEEGGSGLSNDNIYKYCLSTSSEEAKDCTWTNYVTGEELNITAPSIGMYYVLVYSIGDKAGNVSDGKDSIGQKVNKLELPLFNKITDYTYTGCEQTYTVPADGYYKIEAWGAQGSDYGGKGSYTTGVIELKKNTVLYVVVGGKTGYNGGYGSNITGGAERQETTTSAEIKYGGGATDIRLTHGDNVLDAASLNSRIMVAGGGGSVTNEEKGAKSGNGGTLYGTDGISHLSVINTENTENKKYNGGGATQTSGGSGAAGATSGNFGYGGDFGTYTDGHKGSYGGGGYYGGGGSTWHSGSGGGSSFISGYSGVNAITSASDRTHTNNTLHYSGKYFIDGSMEEDANSGNGKAKITFISKEKPERVNPKLDDVRYIKDCIVGNSINVYNHWVELQAIYQGENVAKGKKVTANTSTATLGTDATDGDITTNKYLDIGTSKKCITVDLGQTYDLDEIAIWHYWKDNRTYYENTTYVSSDNVDWASITMPTKEESLNGNRVNAYENEIKVNPYFITNLLKNSGFENGTNYINLSTENSISNGRAYSGSYSLYTSTKSRWTGSILSVDNNKISINDIMYIAERFLITEYNPDTSFMYMTLSNANGYDYIIATMTGITSVWKKTSGFGTIPETNNTGNYSVLGNLFQMDNDTSSTVNSAYIDNLVVYNLTTDFGSGSEPEQAWCDVNIPYISNSAIIYLPKIGNKYISVVDSNGGYRVSDGSTEKYAIHNSKGGVSTLTERRRDGYTLAGYTLSNLQTGSTTALGEASIIFDQTTKQALFTQGTEPLYVTANWSINSYTVTVNPNGGILNGTTNSSIYNITYGNTEAIPNPTKTGYAFAGWTVSGAGSSINGTTFTMGYENATLIANWTPVKPTYTYTGSSQFIDDGNGNWRIKFLTSGTLTFTNYGNAEKGIDIFLVGGGGGGHAGVAGDYEGSGGGGGYTTTVRNYSLTTNVYNIVIGAGGTPGSGDGASGSGGASYFGSIGVNGGIGGSNYHYNASNDRGGDGGSGGGTWYGTGGSDGGAGTRGNGTTYGTPGVGQGTTTREFGESTGTLYAGGGAGGLYSTVGVNGGTGGGGGTNTSGQANTGGGGGGGNSSTNSAGGYGGSGIVIIRNYISSGQSVQCSAGYYGETSTTGCSICLAGTYSQAGASSCSTCPAGTYSSAGASSCGTCPAGTYSQAGASSCGTCSAGTYSSVGASSCTTCPSGQTSNTGASSCYTPESSCEEKRECGCKVYQYCHVKYSDCSPNKSSYYQYTVCKTYNCC